jgi:hypothetical protein
MARDHIDFNTFSSTSRNPSTAKDFAIGNLVGDHTHRVVYELTLRGFSGRDIAPFSQKPEEAEVLLMPGARFRVTGRTKKYNQYGIYIYTMITAEEVAPSAGPSGV